MAVDRQRLTRIRSIMQDPSAQAVARIYAEAFLNAAAAAKVAPAEALEEFASFVEEVLGAVPDFAAILYSGAVGRDEKLSLIDRVVAPRGSELFASFLRVLIRHDRIDLLPLILQQARVVHDLREGRRAVAVTTAVPLDESTFEDVRRGLAAALPFEPVIQTQTDAGLLGGMVIRIDNTVFDGSLRTRMEQLRNRLRERYLNEIQSGRDRFCSAEGD